MECQKVWIQTEDFKIESVGEGGEKKYIFSGIALPFNKESRNGYTYNQKKAIETKDTLKNKSFLFNHNMDNVLGHTTENIEVDEEGIHYEVDVDPEEKDFIRKAKRKDIRNVSIGVIVERVIEEEGKLPDFFIKEFVELSAVSVSGFADASLTSKEFMSIESFVNKQGWRKQEPFAGYKDMDDCINKNKDKKDPKGYCASIKKKAEEEKEKLELNKYYTPNKDMVDDKDKEPVNKDKDKEQEALVEMKETLVKLTERIDTFEERIVTLETSLKETNKEQEKLIVDNKRVEKSIIENQGIEQKQEFSKEGLFKAQGVEL